MKQTVREYYAARANAIEGGETPSFGLGDVVALARLRAGETVLDLGSGPGHDLLAAARAVGSSGRAVGVDMTPEMIARARDAAASAGLDNVSVIDGDLERLPLPCGSIDVVISNCVINLVDDKRRALVEAFRVLAPGGRLAVLDTAFESEPSAEVRSDASAWSCCVAGALVADDYATILRDIGFEDVHVDFTDTTCGESREDGVQARAAEVRATKPAVAGRGVGARPAVARDLRAITALLESEGLPLDGFAVEDAIVVHDASGLAGVVAVERYGDATMLRSLAVRPDARRAGLGRRLVGGALDVARWSGASEVYLVTASAQRYFEPFGFEPVSRERARKAAPSLELDIPECSGAAAMRLSFEEANVPVLGKPSRKPLPTFDEGRCC